mmetsp:Transcript_6352/g.22651  ORF Transcript_6352/g.22651 Transcript_6352/m.22651 type:complete len:225 (+) Transcript_6352:839-1513(+)
MCASTWRAGRMRPTGARVRGSGRRSASTRKSTDSGCARAALSTSRSSAPLLSPTSPPVRLAPLPPPSDATAAPELPPPPAPPAAMLSSSPVGRLLSSVDSVLSAISTSSSLIVGAGFGLGVSSAAASSPLDSSAADARATAARWPATACVVLSLSSLVATAHNVDSAPGRPLLAAARASWEPMPTILDRAVKKATRTWPAGSVHGSTFTSALTPSATDAPDESP